MKLIADAFMKVLSWKMYRNLFSREHCCTAIKIVKKKRRKKDGWSKRNGNNNKCYVKCIRRVLFWFLKLYDRSNVSLAKPYKSPVSNVNDSAAFKMPYKHQSLACDSKSFIDKGSFESVTQAYFFLNGVHCLSRYGKLACHNKYNE
jgi:hypothetical protein